MSTDWYLINSKPTFISGYENDDFNSYATDGFQELLDESPLSSSVELLDNNLNVVKTLNVIIQNNTNDSIIKASERQMLMPIGSLDCYYIRYKNKLWLTVSLLDDNKIYDKVIIKLCNWTLKFQSSDGTILSYPCVVENATKYDNGENEGKIITVGSSQHLVTLPFDIHTINLRTPRRVYLDKHPTNPTSYKITQNDSTTMNFGDKGLIILSLTQDMTRADKDRPDLGICDYFEPSSPTQPPNQSGILSYATITCSNPSNTVTIGGTRTLTAKFYNKDANDNVTEVTDVVANWTFEYPVGLENQFTITNLSNNQVRIRANDNVALIGKKVVVGVNDGSGDYVGSLELTVGSGV